MLSPAALDAELTRIARDQAATVTDVVAIARGGRVGHMRRPAEALAVLHGWFLRDQTVSVEQALVYVLARASLEGVDLSRPARRDPVVRGLVASVTEGRFSPARVVRVVEDAWGASSPGSVRSSLEASGTSAYARALARTVHKLKQRDWPAG